MAGPFTVRQRTSSSGQLFQIRVPYTTVAPNKGSGGSGVTASRRRSRVSRTASHAGKGKGALHDFGDFAPEQALELSHQQIARRHVEAFTLEVHGPLLPAQLELHRTAARVPEQGALQ